MPLLDYADLKLNNGKLFNQTFADIYFQPCSGFDESDHTFIHANKLCERFDHLAPHQTFTVGEIGFGSGLNFINTVQHFFNSVVNNAHAETANENTGPHLFYCSVEKHPIRLAQLREIQQQWPLASLRQSLYAQYPHNHPGFHCLALHPQVTLLLLMGEATQMLTKLAAKVDAWFLDGFAPGRNPDCWSASLFAQIARCSHAQTTLSSFSAARLLRDNLTQNGFTYEKRPGYGTKRDMITATAASQTSPATAPYWTDLPKPSHHKHQCIAIIGAGIAGATTASALAKHSKHITVFHAPDAQPAASAVPLAVPYLQPGLHDSVIRRYQLNAWHHALRHLTALTEQNPDILDRCRIIRQPQNAQEEQRHKKLFAQQLLNDEHWTFTQGELHYLQGGVIRPPALLDTLLAPSNICLVPREIHSLQREGEQWRVDERLFDIVIVATGWQTALYPDKVIKQILRPIRGQGTLLNVSEEHKPQHIYCDSHAFIPHPNETIVYAGSSYSPNDHQLNWRTRDDQANKTAYLRKFPPTQTHFAGEECDIVQSFVGIRGAANDYQPLLGPMPCEEDTISKYRAWAKDSRLPIEQSLSFYPGLYVNAGYGSKGMTNAFLNADILSAMIYAKPLPVDRHLLKYLLPARVIIKDIIRRRLNTHH